MGRQTDEDWNGEHERCGGNDVCTGDEAQLDRRGGAWFRTRVPKWSGMWSVPPDLDSVGWGKMGAYERWAASDLV
jgi:hypothetical protein